MATKSKKGSRPKKSSKSKKKKKTGGGQTVVRQRKVVTLDQKLQKVYELENLDTVCCRQCTCCRVAMPQIKNCEAINIIDQIWHDWSREDKKELLMTAVRYFFSDSLIKPCPLLDGAECRVYGSRPLNCRLYGLWPEGVWEKRVEMFSQNIDLPREKLPLNTQCGNVQRKQVKCVDCDETDLEPQEAEQKRLACKTCNSTGFVIPPPLTEDQIQVMFDALDAIDIGLGVSRKKVEGDWNYRTLHDWLLIRFWGEHTLVQWTNMVLVYSKTEIEMILEAFEEQVEELIP
jgi:Fe-S-cluster containining protein